MTVIYVFLGIAAGALIGFLVARSKDVSEKALLISKRDVLQERTDALQEQLKELRADNEKKIAELKAQYDSTIKTLEENNEKQLKQHSTLIREQINTASEEILKKRSEELSSTNKAQLAEILNPLQENLKLMKEAVEKSDREQTSKMERLDASILANLKQAREIGDRADKLAQALTNENKTQGNFGELRLRTLLESMDLEEGIQFEEQVAIKDDKGNAIYEEENGRRMIPDVILHFPENRDVIIDSKMSLKAFEEYYRAETDEQKSMALKNHIASVRNHAKELAHKNYNSYLANGHRKLDFVLMYIYSESALQLALTNDPGLWKEAYDNGVVISGSQNLYMMLRVLEMTWRQVRQAENQEEIMKTANELINRVQLFYERFLDVEDQFRKTNQAFEKLKTSTSPTGISIITSANKLLKYGAQESSKRKVRLPKATDDDLLLEDTETE